MREGKSAGLSSDAIQRVYKLIPVANSKAAICRHIRFIPGADDLPLAIANDAVIESVNIK